MSGTFVDTNVLLDLATNDATWADWSERQLDAASLRGPLLINDVVYAELSVRFATIEKLDEFIDAAGLGLTPMRPEHLRDEGERGVAEKLCASE